MLGHDTCPRFSLFRPIPQSSRTGVGRTRGRRGNCGFVPPLKTGCHQAQLGMSLGHQHVYTKLSLVSRWERINPSPPRRYRIISFLNFVSLPYERRFFLSSLSLGSPSPLPPVRSLFHVAATITPVSRNYILCPLWRLSLTLPAPCRGGFVRHLWRNILFINFQGEYTRYPWLVNSNLKRFGWRKILRIRSLKYRARISISIQSFSDQFRWLPVPLYPCNPTNLP